MAQVLEFRPTGARMRATAEVRAWKGRLRMSQADLAALLGLSQASVSAQLAGTALFTLDGLDVLAEAFGVDVAELISPGVAARLEGSDTRAAA